jgi:hypothetical protein
VIVCFIDIGGIVDHSFMKFCPVVPEICRGQVHGARKERRRRRRIIIIIIIRNGAKTIIIIIIRNGAKTISLQTNWIMIET